MRKIIEYKDIKCKECCLSCEKDKNTCEYRKQRGRAIKRWAYRAKKEYERKLKRGD